MRDDAGVSQHNHSYEYSITQTKNKVSLKNHEQALSLKMCEDSHESTKTISHKISNASSVWSSPCASPCYRIHCVGLPWGWDFWVTGSTWLVRTNWFEPSLMTAIWVFPKIGVPQNRWFIRENPIKMDDLGVPLFSETSIYTTSGSEWWTNTYIVWFWSGSAAK